MADEQNRNAARRSILHQWMQEQERGVSWVARKIGYSREYVANVLSGRYPFTDQISRSCAEYLEIDFGYVGPKDSDREPAALALV